MENKYTLYELNEYIRRVIALNLPDAVWISCEIAQVNNSKGRAFVHLVQKEEDGEAIVAKSEAVIWQTDFRRLKRKFGADFDSILQEGMQVMFQVKVDYHERFGLKLVIVDLDPAYTIGKLAMQRQQIIELLKKENLLQKNKQLTLPAVIKRIAILSSATAAGYQDYLNQIAQNQFAYQFENQLFPTTMQGDKVEAEMTAQLKEIAKHKAHFDCVIIIRGGGARLDLAAFDGLKLSKAIANFPLPIIAGIGHEVDESVVDMVAHTSLKTPTAVAEFIIQNNLNFEMMLSDLGMAVRQLAQQQLTNQSFSLNRLENQFQFSADSILKGQQRMLDFVEEKIPSLLKTKLKSEDQAVLNFEKIVQLLSPENTLKRGFSLSLLNGKTITSSKQAKLGDELETVLFDGKIKSKIL